LPTERFTINPKPKAQAIIATAISNVLGNGFVSIGAGVAVGEGDAKSGSSMVTLEMSKRAISG